MILFWVSWWCVISGVMKCDLICLVYLCRLVIVCMVERLLCSKGLVWLVLLFRLFIMCIINGIRLIMLLMVEIISMLLWFCGVKCVIWLILVCVGFRFCWISCILFMVYDCCSLVFVFSVVCNWFRVVLFWVWVVVSLVCSFGGSEVLVFMMVLVGLCLVEIFFIVSRVRCNLCKVGRLLVLLW